MFILIFFGFFNIAQPFFSLSAGAILLISKEARRAPAGESVKFLQIKAVYSTSVMYVSIFF